MAEQIQGYSTADQAVELVRWIEAAGPIPVSERHPFGYAAYGCAVWSDFSPLLKERLLPEPPEGTTYRFEAKRTSEQDPPYRATQQGQVAVASFVQILPNGQEAARSNYWACQTAPDDGPYLRRIMGAMSLPVSLHPEEDPAQRAREDERYRQIETAIAPELTGDAIGLYAVTFDEAAAILEFCRNQYDPASGLPS